MHELMQQAIFSRRSREDGHAKLRLPLIYLQEEANHAAFCMEIARWSTKLGCSPECSVFFPSARAFFSLVCKPFTLVTRSAAENGAPERRTNTQPLPTSSRRLAASHQKTSKVADVERLSETFLRRQFSVTFREGAFLFRENSRRQIS